MAIDDTVAQAELIAETERLNKTFVALSRQTYKQTRALDTSIKYIVQGAKTRKEANAALKNYRLGLEEELKDKKNQGKASQDIIKAQIKATDKLGFEYSRTGRVLASVYKELKGLGKGVISTTKRFLDAEERIQGFSDLVKDITLFGFDIFGPLAESADFNVGIFKTLAQQGADFGKSLITLRETAYDANMPLLDFVDFIGKNTESLAKFFGTTNQSTADMAVMARSMRQITKDQFAEFGLNFEETNEFMTTYLELQRAAGAAENMSRQQLIEGSARYTKNLILLSKITGESVTDLNKQNEQLRQNGVFQAAMAKVDEKERERLTAFVTSLGGPTTAMGGLAVDLIAAGAPITELSRSLAGTNKDAYRAIENFIKGGASVGEIPNVIGELRVAANQFLKDFPQAAAYFRTEFVDLLGDYARMAGGEVNEEMVKTEMDARGDATDSLVGFREELDTTSANMQAITTNILRPLVVNGGEFIKKMGEVLSDISGKAESISANWINRVLTSDGNALKVKIVEGKEVISKLGTADAPGKGKLWSMADDSMFGMAKRGGARFGEGESLTDILTPWDTEAEKIKKIEERSAGSNTFYEGTVGATGKLFNNFGTGTPTVLHGEEAVIPKASLFGGILDSFNQKIAGGKTTTDNTQIAGTPTTDDTQLIALNNTAKQIANSSQKLEQYLNTLITIGAMTEKNTKIANKNLANLSGSLV